MRREGKEGRVGGKGERGEGNGDGGEGWGKGRQANAVGIFNYFRV